MKVVKYGSIAVSTIIAVLFACTSLQAQEEFSVKLQEIQKIKPQEKRGDELFISVTEFPKGQTPRHYQIPSFPTHWLSNYLTNVKDVSLWQKNIQGCQDVKVIFSLVEEDFAPWNLDDLLGSVELNVKCEQGKFVTDWIIPNKEITEPLANEKNTFTFKGNKAEYRARFKLEQKDVKPAIKQK